MAPGRHDEMSCRELVGVITDYLEGTLPELLCAPVQRPDGT
jgi:hypothetical protein